MFSNRISALQPSAIREILKVTADPSVLSFAAGNPSPETFPVKEISEIASELFASQAASALQYGITEGYAPLRQITSKRLSEKFGIGRDTDELIITSGGQQAIELSAKVLLNEGDTMISEDPSFIGALNAFRSYNADIKGVPCDNDGMDVDALEKILEKTPNVKLVYTIPTFQNPNGSVMSAVRRKRLLELAEKYNFYIIEDSPYLELRYSGEAVMPIKSSDENKKVIYCGSYSKTISPGIRLGYMCAPKEIINKVVVAKQVNDVHSNLFFQMLVSEFLTRYDFDVHINRSIDIYREKLDCMTENLKKFTPNITFTEPQGGLFMWCNLTGITDVDFAKAAAAQKVAVVPGSAFSVIEGVPTYSIRLNYSLPSLEQIEEGCRRMGNLK